MSRARTQASDANARPVVIGRIGPESGTARPACKAGHSELHEMRAKHPDSVRAVEHLLDRYPPAVLDHMVCMVRAKRRADAIRRLSVRARASAKPKARAMPIATPPPESTLVPPEPWMVPVVRAWPGLPACTRQAVVRTCDPLARERLGRAVGAVFSLNSPG